MEDAALSARFTAAEFEQLYRRHAGPLCAYLARCAHGNMAEAEAVTQEAFLKAWEQRGELRDLGAFRAWLYSIALNEFRRRWRSTRLVALGDADTECGRPGPEQRVQDGQLLARAMAALDDLPENQREAVLLVRMENMKFREAAEILGVPESTVKTWVRRGLLRIARELGL